MKDYLLLVGITIVVILTLGMCYIFQPHAHEYNTYKTKTGEICTYYYQRCKVCSKDTIIVELTEGYKSDEELECEELGI